MTRITLRRIVILSCLLNIAIFLSLLRLRREHSKRLPPGWTGETRQSQFRSIQYLERRLNFDLTRLEKQFRRTSQWPEFIFQIDFTSARDIRPWIWPISFNRDALSNLKSEKEAIQTWSDMNPGFKHIVSNKCALQRYLLSQSDDW
jgi:vacuolar-type H+-ATPase subunit I/STV1